MRILIYEPGRGLYDGEASSDYRTRLNIGKAENVIIKAGSDVLLTEDGRLDRETIHHLFEQMVGLMRKGKRITYVSSGARVAGEEYVGRKAGEMTSRALCTAGQSRLMQVYHEIASIWPDLKIGQALLEDIHFQNARRGKVKKGFDEFFEGCVSIGCAGIMIVNANDFAWTGETKYDNDTLTANLYRLLKADLAIYLTNVDGLISGFGSRNERLVNLVYGINTGIYGLVTDSKSRKGTGGLETKLRRGVKKILDQRGKAVIANGKKENVILDVMCGENTGTFFCRKV